MASRTATRLTDLLSSTRRLALVGLAKNTGKTQTLGAILAEHAAAGRPVGVTSIGRDGEAHDVIDARIDKPRVRLEAGTLVASTGALLRASGAALEVLVRTGMRTPLGEVVVARMCEGAAVEVAGPAAAADVRDVSDVMAGLGAEQVLIDGAVDRRAASSPAVADGLVIATGAVLSKDIGEVVASTRDAVELVRLPVAEDCEGAPPERKTPAQDGQRIVLPRGLVLGADPGEIARLLVEHPRAGTLLVDGALSEGFLEGLLAARRQRAGRRLTIVVGDPTKVFLSRRGLGWYRRQGVEIAALRGIALKAITVNPVAPQSHRFESARLCSLIGQALPDVPVIDVLDSAYSALSEQPAPT